MIDQMESPKQLVSTSISAIGPFKVSRQSVVLITLRSGVPSHGPSFLSFKHNGIQLVTVYYFQTKICILRILSSQEQKEKGGDFFLSMTNVYKIACFWCLDYSVLHLTSIKHFRCV